MENIKGRANSYAQWILQREGCLKAARLPQFLEDMLIEQKKIDDRECETMVGAAAKEVKQVMIDKACEWLFTHWRDYVATDRDGVIRFGGWEGDFRKAMEK